MYLMETVVDDALLSKGVSPAPFGPGFDKDILKRADRMEVWGSSFNDPGDDFCEFRLFARGNVIATRRVGGY